MLVMFTSPFQHSHSHSHSYQVLRAAVAVVAAQDGLSNFGNLDNGVDEEGEIETTDELLVRLNVAVVGTHVRKRNCSVFRAYTASIAIANWKTLVDVTRWTARCMDKDALCHGEYAEVHRHLLRGSA